MKDIERRVHDNEINISKLAKSIRENIESIENLDKQIQTIAESAENIASIESAVATNAAAIEEIKASGTDTTALEQQIAQNTQNITQNIQSLEAHAETLTDFDTSIKFLSNTSSELLQRVALLEDNASESSEVLEPRLAEVERKQAEAQIEINALNNALGETKTTVLGLETQVAENKEAIEELKAGGTGAADTTALEQQIAQNATNIEALQATVTTLQTATQVNATNIAENSAKIAGIQETYRVVANALNRITALEQLHGLAEEVWGERGTTVEEITALLDDYATESNFCTETSAHLQFGTFGETGPSARIFFRQNPLRTTNPKVVLKFDFSNLPSGISALPCTITLNEAMFFSGDLVVDLSKSEFQATAILQIDPSVHNIVMFNEIKVQFNDTGLANTILDFVKVEITNSQNCIVLNRANHVNIYGWVNKAEGTKRLVCTKYYKGQGFKTFMSTGSTHLMDLESSATTFPASTAGGYPVVWSSRYLQENFNLNSNGRFTTLIDYQLDYYVNNQNQLFVLNNIKPASTLTATFYHVDNILYAKKSLHNGIMGELEDALVVHNDFSIAKYYAHFYTSTPSYFLDKQTFKLSSKEYTNEFVDFVPVHDHTTGASKTTRHNIGYFLLHKSGNILFVPETSSKYFIKIGKGSQITASYHTGFMGINIFYQHNGKVYKKVLTREEFNSTEWTLSENVEIIENADYIFDNDLYQFKIKNGEITQIIK